MAGASSILAAIILVSPNLLAKPIMDFTGVPWLDSRIKDHVNLFKGATLCLRVCEEHLEGHDGTEDPENNIGFPLDVVEGGGDKVRQCKVENPVGGG